MEYLSWKEEVIDDFRDESISAMYNNGFVFTRLDKGVMKQTRSVRIDLKKFELTSENRRILKKVGGIEMQARSLPYAKYDWSLGKLAKDFYENKFGAGIFSAQKAKEIMVSEKSNFNLLLNYNNMGYVICYINNEILHYSYPFYDLKKAPKDLGLGMMTKAIVWAKEKGLKYIYLGSLQRPTDTYKLQFEGIEWFDGNEWRSDTEEVKKILSK